jgi:hypothetical protein
MGRLLCSIWRPRPNYSPNKTGISIWQGLKSGLSLKEISQQSEFAVDSAENDGSVLELANEVTRHQLVQVLK